jgi:hypothetical protein
VSNTPFTTSSVSILDFDIDAAGVGFVGVESVAAVSVPAAAPLLATALAGPSVWVRRRL